MNMIETVLERSRMGGSKNIYIMGDIFNIFFVKLWKRKFFQTLNALEMAKILTPKWTSKKAFLKNCNLDVLVPESKTSFSGRIFFTIDLFLLTRAFDRWQLECHTTSQNFFTAGNQTFFGFLEMTQATIVKFLQNPSPQKFLNF